MRYQGRITQWSEEDGIGYIQCSSLSEPVLLCKDAIYHGQSKPKLGDEVTFSIVDTEQGEQARDLIYVQRTLPTIKPTRYEKPATRKNRTALIIMIFFGFLVLKLFVPKDDDELNGPHNAPVNAGHDVGNQSR